MNIREAWRVLWGRDNTGGEPPKKKRRRSGDSEDEAGDEYEEALAKFRQAHMPLHQLTAAIHGGGELRRLTESLPDFGTPTFPNPDAGTEFDDKFYLNIDRTAPLDLPPRMQQTAQRLSLLLYRKNVRAKRAIELVTDFVWGDGPRIRANDPKVKAVLDEHWTINQWRKKGPERVRSLGIFGEQLYPAFVNEKTGLVRVSSVSPLLVYWARRHHDNAEDVVAVHTRVMDVPENVAEPESPDHYEAKHQGRPFEVILPGDDGTLAGQAFYFAVNRIAGATRGLPDLLPSIDWLEGMDSYAFGLLERAVLTQNIIWDLECQGCTPTEIQKHVDAFVRALRKSGGVYGHNEKLKLNIKVPTLAAADAKSTVGVLLRQIQSGTGLAGLFYGDAEDLTRASASELSVPVAKMIQARQTFVRDSLTEILLYQVQQSAQAGRLEGVTDTSFEIDFPRVWLRDLETISKALLTTGNALSLAVDEGWLLQAEARTLYRGALEQLGPVATLPPTVAEPELAPAEIEVAQIMDRVRRERPPDEKPIAPPRPPGPTPEEQLAEVTRLNGAQVTAALGIIERVAEGTLPRQAGINMLQVFFGLTEEQAIKVFGTIGQEEAVATAG